MVAEATRNLLIVSINHGFHPCQQTPYVIMFMGPDLLTNTLMIRLQCVDFGGRNIQNTMARTV